MNPTRWTCPLCALAVALQLWSAAPAQEEQAGRGRPAADDLSEDSPHWPSFRGHRARGFAEGAGAPTAWSLETGENVLWQTPIPGLAHSSPIVWGDRLFVTTAVRQAEGDTELKVGLYGDISSVADEGVHQFRLLCLDKKDGQLLWSRTAHEGAPAVKRHPKSSHAASTPATDGEHVVAFFGSEGLYCYDTRGELLWQKDFGVLDSGFYMAPEAQWGFASSPVLHAGRVIVQVDVQEDSFLAAFDADTGEELWRTPRHDVPTWSSPTVDVRSERGQVIVNGYKHIGGYDLGTGAELWKLAGGGDIPVPTPVVAHDLIFITNAHGRMAPIYAISVAASGELKGTAQDEQQMAWSTPRRGNYMQTPLVYGEELYCCSDAGILTCYEADTGVVRYQQRLGGGASGFSASAVATDGRLYLTSEEGEVHVVAAGPEFESLAVNDMGETCMATPAISEGVLFWRTRSHVVAVAER
jgi:outer membrane protein assembly factor BamB